MKLGIISRDGVIGPGWSEDPEERARQIAEQERVVSDLARIEEKVSIFDLDVGAMPWCVRCQCYHHETAEHIGDSCLKETCRSPVACGAFGYCRERNE